MNAVAVDSNKRTFELGRLMAHDPAKMEATVAPVAPPVAPIAGDLETVVGRRVAFLEGYQDRAYGKRYGDLVDRVRSAEAGLGGGEHLTAKCINGL